MQFAYIVELGLLLPVAFYDIDLWYMNMALRAWFRSNMLNIISKRGVYLCVTVGGGRYHVMIPIALPTGITCWHHFLTHLLTQSKRRLACLEFSHILLRFGHGWMLWEQVVHQTRRSLWKMAVFFTNAGDFLTTPSSANKVIMPSVIELADTTAGFHILTKHRGPTFANMITDSRCNASSWKCGLLVWAWSSWRGMVSDHPVMSVERTQSRQPNKPGPNGIGTNQWSDGNKMATLTIATRAAASSVLISLLSFIQQIYVIYGRWRCDNSSSFSSAKCATPCRISIVCDTWCILSSRLSPSICHWLHDAALGKVCGLSFIILVQTFYHGLYSGISYALDIKSNLYLVYTFYLISIQSNLSWNSYIIQILVEGFSMV